MADRFSIALLGLPQLQARLAATPERLERLVVSESLRDGAVYLSWAARQRIHSRTGRLAASLNVKALRPHPGRVGWGVWSGRNSQLGIRNPKWYYPAHMHMGHAFPYQGPLSVGRRRAARNRRLGRQARVASRPFLRAALILHQQRILYTIANSMSRRLAMFGY